MKKLISLVLCLALALSCTAALAERTIRFGTTSAEGTEVVNVMYKFGELLAEKTGGSLKVEVFPGSQLGDATTSFQNVQLGIQEMVVATAANMANVGAKDFLALSMPYVFRDMAHMIDVCHGEIGQKMLASTVEAGTRVVGIGFWSEGARNFFTKEPVRSLADVKGLKLRCQSNDIDTAMAEALGASATPIAFAELYSALQTGVVDGAENPTSAIYTNKFYEVCKYVTIDEHSAPPVVIVMSEMIWNTLTADEQKAVMDAWAEASAHNLDYLNSNQAKYTALLEAEGVEVITLTDKADWSAAMAPVYAEFGSEITDVLDAIAALK